MSRPRRVVLYQDAAGEWRWKTVAGNGRTVAASEEGFKSRSYALDRAKASHPDLGVYENRGGRLVLVLAESPNGR